MRASHQARQLLQHDPADQQELEPVGQLVPERALHAREAMQGVGQPESGARTRAVDARHGCSRSARRCARASDEALDADQQLLEDPSRHRAVPEMLQQQLALAIGKRDQAESDAVAVGDLGIEGVARGGLGDPLLVGPQHVAHRALFDVVLGRRQADRVAHVAERQSQHLIAQRLVDRGQPVDAEQTDHRAQRRAVDQKREQDEAGRQDRDEALDLGVDRTVLGDCERERERDRAAQRRPTGSRTCSGGSRAG